MKSYLSILFILIPIVTFGQDKFDYTRFNKLTEVKGTDFVIASVDNRGKMAESISKYLLFINSKTGNTTKVEFPADGSIQQVEQVKIDSLEINKVLVVAKTIDLDEKSGIDWTDPMQIFVLTPDGKEKIQLTEDSFFISTWVINNQSGSIVITGHYDTNKNGKYDKKDQNKIVIYDLKSLEIIRKI